jgi:hypothetical protein
MSCTRCGGLCHVERIRRRGQPTVTLWACYSCGDRVDDTIRWYRAQAREAAITKDWKARVWQDVCALARGEVPR